MVTLWRVILGFLTFEDIVLYIISEEKFHHFTFAIIAEIFKLLS